MDGDQIWQLVAAWVTVLLMMSTETGAECLTEEWQYDAAKQRCIMISATPVQYSAAVRTCADSGGDLFRIESLEDRNQLWKIFGDRIMWRTVWLDYVLERHDESYRVYGSRGSELDISQCGRCVSLKQQASQLRIGTRACAQVTVNYTSQWSVSDCDERHYAVCQYFKDTDAGRGSRLRTADIAAIVVGSLLVLAFVVTLIIDCRVRQWKQKNQYLRSNIVSPSIANIKTVSDVDIFRDFGSKTKLFPTLNHV